MHLCCFVLSKKSHKLRTFSVKNFLVRKSGRVNFLTNLKFGYVLQLLFWCCIYSTFYQHNLSSSVLTYNFRKYKCKVVPNVIFWGPIKIHLLKAT